MSYCDDNPDHTGPCTDQHDRRSASATHLTSTYAAVTDEAPPSITFTCSQCGTHATVGPSIYLAVLAIHLTLDATGDWQTCSKSGGPFHTGTPATELENDYREAHGLAYFR